MSDGDGKFASITDVTNRYEKAFPDDRKAWVALHIADVENELMGQVPSLRKPLADINADSAAAGDPGRLDRVKALVCNKVLSLYRNPEGLTQLQRTMPDLTTSRTYRNDGVGQVAFTDAELDGVRLHTKRPQFGSATLGSWSTKGRWDGCSY